MEARHERARTRQRIRAAAREVRLRGEAGLCGKYDNELGERLLEQLVLAICNLAETVDARGLEP